MKPGYITPKAKLDKIRKRRVLANIMRQLERGDWEAFLIKANKAKHQYRDIQTHSGEIKPLLMKINIVKMSIRLHVLALVGKAVTVSLPEEFEDQRAALSGIRKRSHFDALIMQAARTANIDSFATLRVDLRPGRGVVICCDDNMMLLPVGPDGPDMQPTVWERRWLIERKAGEKLHKFLRVERHSAPGEVGQIEQEVYEYSGSDLVVDLNSDLVKRVDLAVALPDEPIEPLTLTGLPYPLITRLVNEYFDGEPEMLISEHDLDLLDLSAATLSRYDRALEKHSAPKVRVSENMIDPDSGKVEIGDALVDPDKLFEYIQQNVDFASMLTAMNKVLQLVCTMLQVSPALLGIKLEGGAMPDTYDKLRLESTNTLSRAIVSARYMTPALERVFTTASLMDTQRPMQGYAVNPVGITMHPGLPRDPIDTARDMSELRGAAGGPLIDLRSALEEIHGATAAEGIYEQLLAENEANIERAQRELMLGFAGGGAA